ncbi:MAG: helix-turn-helix domain-containing protein [Candidatus Accumulibacter sp.]|jgi:transcriptional regulator with XRE-family HTH domain|nr:helix-turn-helix domain-containing protein [Accumulibacter sp.]
MISSTVFAQRLKQARLRAGLTQMQLGVVARIDEYSASARVNQYERGKHWPDFGTAERLAEATNVPAPYFYARDETLADLLLIWRQLDQVDRDALVSLARSRFKSLDEG